jgi:hypothetical protein
VKLGKDAALMALGAGAVLAYQKYNKPVKKAIGKKFKKTSHKLDTMM